MDNFSEWKLWGITAICQSFIHQLLGASEQAILNLLKFFLPNAIAASLVLHGLTKFLEDWS